MVAVVKEVLLRQDDQPVHCQKGKEEDGDQRQNSGRAPRENRHESQRQINLALVSAFPSHLLIRKRIMWSEKISGMEEKDWLETGKL